MINTVVHILFSHLAHDLWHYLVVGSLLVVHQIVKAHLARKLEAQWTSKQIAKLDRRLH